MNTFTKPSRWLMPIVAILIIVAAYGVTKATGVWSSSTKSATVSHAVSADTKPEDLKGWMTLQQVADVTTLPVSTLLELAGAPSGTMIEPSTPMRELEASIPGFSMTDFRAKVAARMQSGAPAG